MSSIPVIDITPLYSSDRNDWQETTQQIDHACRHIGFFAIQGFAITPTQMHTMFQLSKAFFAQTTESKQQIDISKSNNHRGWGSQGAEQLDPDSPSDWKETFDMALDIHPEHPIVTQCPELYGPNQYGELKGFQQTVNQHYGLLLDIAKRLLRVMALALHLEEDHFTRYFEGEHISVFRMIHYPPRPTNQPVDNNSMAAGAHTDYGCITLLAQDNIGGLQVQTKEGEWLDVAPLENTLIVNIGDLMQRWTNDHYRSTAHRVRNLKPGTHRYSMPFFVEPRFDTPVETIASCITKDTPQQYDSVTSGDWILSRFAATYEYRQE